MHRSALSDIKREAEAETVLRGPYNVISPRSILASGKYVTVPE